MARVLIEGFESGNLGFWTKSGCEITTAKEGMSGNSCVYLQANSSVFLSHILPSASSYYFAGKMRYEKWMYYGQIQFRNGPTDQISIRHNSEISPVEVVRGDTTLVTGTKLLVPDKTYLIEIYVFISDSSGRVIVKINGITDIDFTGDTQNISGNNLINNIQISSNYLKTWWDDIIIDDSNWIGETRIMGLSPTGAGATTQWTPSTGSNWQNVDEKPADNADYNSVNEINKIDTFTIEDMSAINGVVNDIKCVQVQARASKDGTPTPQNLNLAVRSGGTNYFSADKEVPTDFETLSNIWEKNPNGNIDWTESAINAMEIGYKSKA